jgi:Divergent InlB B-repeat domain
MGNGIHRRAAAAAIALAIALTAVAFNCGVASAASSHPFLGALDGSQTPPPSEFNKTCGVTVDSAGDLYVASFGTSAIYVYDPEHQYLTTITDTEGPCDIAVDSKGNVYARNVYNDMNDPVVEYAPSEYPPTAATTYGAPTTIYGGSDPTTNLAVNPANDHVLVAIENAQGGHINEYQSAANGSGVLSEAIGLGLFEAWDPFHGLAVDGSTGNIYVVVERTDANGNGVVIAVLNPAGTAILTEIGGSDSPKGSLSFGPFGLTPIAVDQSDGNVYIPEFKGAVTGREIYEFREDGTFVSAIGPTFGGSLTFASSGPSGVAVDNSTGASAGNLYVGNGEQEAVIDEFGPLAVTQELTVSVGGAGSGTVTSTPAGIRCPGACSGEFTEGGAVTLAEEPAAGSEFAGWSGCDSEAEGGKQCLVTMSAANAVTASFKVAAAAPQQFSLAVSNSGSGSGTVTSAPAGVSCGSTCSATFVSGTRVTLTASPSAGSTFTGWSGACAGAGACEVTMSAAQAVTASFTAAGSSGSPGSCATIPALCPAPAPGPPTTIPTLAGAPTVLTTAKVKGGKAEVRVSCAGPGDCAGALTLTAKLKIGKKKKTVTIGTAPFSVPAGGSATVKIKLSSKGRSALESGKPLSAKVLIDGKQLTTVMLNPGRVPKKKGAK